MEEQEITIVDAVFPSGAVSPVLRLTDRDGEIRIFTLTEIMPDATYKAVKTAKSLEEAFRRG